MYAVALTVLALSVSSSYSTSVSLRLRHYGFLGELSGTGFVSVLFVMAIAVMERQFLVECWKKIR